MSCCPKGPFGAFRPTQCRVFVSADAPPSEAPQAPGEAWNVFAARGMPCSRKEGAGRSAKGTGGGAHAQATAWALPWSAFGVCAGAKGVPPPPNPPHEGPQGLPVAVPVSVFIGFAKSLRQATCART